MKVKLISRKELFMEEKTLDILVSVIVPVYNVEKYLRDCLNSLLEQTLEKIEIIVVNDGSTDGSSLILKEYSDKNLSKLRVIHQENRGLGSARNAGMKYAQGKYIMFVDSDDWLENDAIEILFNHAQQTDSDVVVFDFTSIYDGWDNGWRSAGYRGKKFPPAKSDFILNSMNPATSCNKLYLRDLFQNIYFSEGWYEDIGTTPILLTYCNKITYLPQKLYFYRQREGSIIQAAGDKRSLDVMDAWKRSMNLCNPDYTAQVEYAVYNNILTFLTFKPEYADEYMAFFQNNSSAFQKNQYIMESIKSGEAENLFTKELIPKIIHYFWFGGGAKSELVLRCIKTWEGYAPDFKIIEWNESNCDVNECSYVQEASRHGKWAFVADYFRMKRIWDQGGFYLDTDMELTGNISALRLHRTFFEFETDDAVNACIFGSVANAPIMKSLLDMYSMDTLIKDGQLKLSETIVIRLTKILKKHYGLRANGKFQVLKDDIAIYPPNVLILNAFDGNNLAVHHYDASWWDVKTGVPSYKYEVLRSYFQSKSMKKNKLRMFLWKQKQRLKKLLRR